MSSENGEILVAIPCIAFYCMFILYIIRRKCGDDSTKDS